MELPVLLKCLFEAGLNGKSWRLVKSWYEGSETCVKIGSHVSHPITICRGVRQGSVTSVLSPLLLIVLMDGLADKLLSSNTGTTLEDLFVGGALHTDDVQMVSNDKCSVMQQAENYSE